MCMHTRALIMSNCAHAMSVHAQSCWALPLRAYMHRLSWNFVWRTENMLVDYIQNLGKIRSGVMEKSAFHWLCMFISNFSLYFQLYSKFKVPSTQTVENYDNPFGIFENLLSKCPSFSGKMTYFLANIVISSPSYSSLVNITDYWTPCIFPGKYMPCGCGVYTGCGGYVMGKLQE